MIQGEAHGQPKRAGKLIADLIARPKASNTRGLRRDEIKEDLNAFQRRYEDDHSWEALKEDEFGRLLSLVSSSASAPA